MPIHGAESMKTVLFLSRFTDIKWTQWTQTDIWTRRSNHAVVVYQGNLAMMNRLLI